MTETVLPTGLFGSLIIELSPSRLVLNPLVHIFSFLLTVLGVGGYHISILITLQGLIF
jgi:hypothetical protein